MWLRFALFYSEMIIPLLLYNCVLLGNDVVITVLLCEQTKLRERTAVMANYALSQAIGFIAGPGKEKN